MKRITMLVAGCQFTKGLFLEKILKNKLIYVKTALNELEVREGVMDNDKRRSDRNYMR